MNLLWALLLCAALCGGAAYWLEYRVGQYGGLLIAVSGLFLLIAAYDTGMRDSRAIIGSLGQGMAALAVFMMLVAGCGNVLAAFWTACRWARAYFPALQPNE